MRSSRPRRSVAFPVLRRRRGLLLKPSLAVAVVALGLAVAGPTAAADPVAAGSRTTLDPSLGSPSVQYVQAMEHARDRIEFTPGDVVSVPFRPRAGDRNLVGGRLPVALPAGRVSGAAMAASAQGSVWTSAADDPLAVRGGSSVDRGPAEFALAPEPADGVATAGSTNVLRREVFGFLPYWELSATINYDVLSTIAYFGVGLDSAGNLEKKDSSGSTTSGWSGWASSKMTTVMNNAHADGTRVVITVECFAWSDSEIASQQALLSSATARLNAAQQIAAAIRDRGADGVNLDFEPIASGQGANFVTFVRTLRSELDKVKPGYQITLDATGYVGRYDAANLVADGGADAIFLMGYDFRSVRGTIAGSIDPLTSPTIYDLTDAVNAYRKLIPASKLILGVPYYGRAWPTVSDQLHAAVQPYRTEWGRGVNVTYSSAMAELAQHGRRYDAVEQAAWTAYKSGSGDTETWNELYFDDAQALGARYDMINYWGLRGAGIWTLGYDGTRTELNDLLAAKFLSDKTPPLAGVVNLAASQDDEGFLVSWTGRDDWSGVKAYDVQVSVDGAAWTAWLTGTTATSATFQGANGHHYAFRARATDGAGNAGPWNVATTYTAAPTYTTGGFVMVVPASVYERSTASGSATVVRRASAGEIFQIIGGPVAADGATWYQVMGPVVEWGLVTPTMPGLWMATGSAGVRYIAPITAPNSSIVEANIYGLTFNARSSNGSLTATRTFTPNGDGTTDRLVLGWTNRIAFDDMKLNVYRSDGSLAGSIALGPRAAGQQSYGWDGTLGTSGILPNARYLLQLTGTSGTHVNYAPSAAPFAAGQWSSLQVTLDDTNIVRYGGASRFDVAATLAKNTFTPGVGVVYIANGLTFPDALAGAAAAGTVKGPILLVTASLPIHPATVDALKTLRPGRIIVLGGTGSVSAAVARELTKYTGGGVTRIGGATRFEVAATLAATTFKPAVGTVYIANAFNFPDALAGAAAAGTVPGPVLLVGSSLPVHPATVAALKTLKPGRIVVLGGTGSVSAAVATELSKYSASVVRYGGADRFEAGVTVSAKTFSPGVDAVYIATAFKFPDALAGASAAGTVKGPVLLVDTSGTLDPAVAAELLRLQPKKIILLGGTASVPAATANAIHALLGPQ